MGHDRQPRNDRRLADRQGKPARDVEKVIHRVFEWRGAGGAPGRRCRLQDDQHDFERVEVHGGGDLDLFKNRSPRSSRP